VTDSKKKTNQIHESKTEGGDSLGEEEQGKSIFEYKNIRKEVC